MTFLKTIGFSIVAMLLFTAFANMLPQVQSDPPVEEEISTDSLDMAGMIVYGERLFMGKGTCTLCHNDLGRAPDLLVMDLASAFNERLADPRNEGVSSGGEGASDIEAYIRESLVEPSAYVVEGLSEEQIAEMWLRRLQTSPAEFLRAKFALQAAVAREEGR